MQYMNGEITGFALGKLLAEIDGCTAGKKKFDINLLTEECGTFSDIAWDVLTGDTIADEWIIVVDKALEDNNPKNTDVFSKIMKSAKDLNKKTTEENKPETSEEVFYNYADLCASFPHLKDEPAVIDLNDKVPF